MNLRRNKINLSKSTLNWKDKRTNLFQWPSSLFLMDNPSGKKFLLDNETSNDIIAEDGRWKVS